MTDETTPQDGKAMPPASTGSDFGCFKFAYLWCCDIDGGISFHDTPEDAQEYGFHSGRDYTIFRFFIPRWTSVSESLPPCGVQVLARIASGRQFSCCYEHGCWTDYDGSVWASRTVTHWMPVLEQPVGADNL